MAEIGIIASVIGVAGAGFRLSLILNAVGSEVVNAGIEIHTIAKGVTLFSLMLKQVGQHLQAHDSVHSQEALDTAKQITEECQNVFDEISDMLDRVQNKSRDGLPSSPTLQQRFKWCFKKHRVTYLLAQLESLKMSLLVMLQILQLGKLMIHLPKSENKEDLAVKSDVVVQERAETQNMIIVRYWAISRLDRLYHLAEHEEREDKKIEMEEKMQNQTQLGGTQTQLTIEAPPDSPTANALIRLPVVSLGELDRTLNQIRDSPRDMIRVSESVIDPLLTKWTRVREIGEHNARATSANRYTPSVDDVYESDEERHWNYTREMDSHDGPHDNGYYLEGTTNNWRQPHSVEAKQEATRLRKQYKGYQPSVDSDADDYNHKPTNRNAPSRHVIDSSSSSASSSDSEDSRPKHRHRRRRSSDSAAEKKRAQHPSDRQSQSYKDVPNLTRFTSSPNPMSSAQRPPSSGNPYVPNPQRPLPQHSFSTPIPPLHTANGMNPYSGNPYGVAPPPYAPYGGQAYGPPYMPPQQSQHLPLPRPDSSDGRNRSPAATPRWGLSPSSHPTANEERRQQKSSHQSAEEQRRQQKLQHQKNLRRGATRGLLSVGAVAGFLEALEGLSL